MAFQRLWGLTALTLIVGCDRGGALGGRCDAGLMTDPQNCGGCRIICPSPVHAVSICVQGACGRSACQPGYFDLDGPATFGCEATCAGNTCTLPDGGTLVLNGTLLPETGAVFQAFSSGTSYGSQLQTSRSFTHVGLLGGSAPPSPGGVRQTSSSFQNVGGFPPADTR